MGKHNGSVIPPSTKELHGLTISIKNVSTMLQLLWVYGSNELR